jgi:3',5'-cyclic AMP phosphodiesterase CpdA
LRSEFFLAKSRFSHKEDQSIIDKEALNKKNHITSAAATDDNTVKKAEISKDFDKYYLDQELRLPKKPFCFAVLGDSHVPPGANSLKKAISKINSTHPLPEFIVITGDLIDPGRPVLIKRAEAMNELKDIIGKSHIPVYLIRGNHDFAHDLDGSFFRESTGFERYYSFDLKGSHFVMLDSSRQPTPFPSICEGYFDKPQLDWLKSDLANTGSSTPICIFMHHLIYEDPRAPIDKRPDWYLNPAEANKLLSIIKKYNVKGVFAGHVHFNSVSIHNGLTQMSVGSIHSNFVPWQNPLGYHHPPGFALVFLNEDGITATFRFQNWLLCEHITA